jgi:superfamily II DNA or RNA helicase
MDLRPYQEELIDGLKDRFRKSHKRVIMQSVTGSGKTVTFVEMAKRTLQRSPESAIVIFTDRLELQEQALKTFKSVGVPCYLLSAGSKMTEFASGVTLCMVETFARRKIDISKVKLVIIDECHKGNFRKIIPKFESVHIIGATATPLSSKKDNPLKNDYQEIVTGLGVKELIDTGYLSSPTHYHLIPKKIALLKEQAGEFTDESQMQVFENAELYADLLREFKRFSHTKTIVFCNNQSTTRIICKQFKDAGYRADFVISGGQEGDTERADVFAKFKTGEIQILVNCGIATTGYDEPSIETVVIYRATKSLPLWLQMCGRGSRVTETKKHFNILDFGGNILRHNFWDSPIDWRHLFLHPPKKKDGVAPIKECPECNALNPVNSPRCICCNHVFEPTKKEVKIVEGQLIEAQRKSSLVGRRIGDLTVYELAELGRLKRYKLGFISRVLRSKGLWALEQFAEIMGYSRGWVLRNQFGGDEFSNVLIKF